MIRIGMIVPSSNTTLEGTTTRLLAGRDDVTFVSTRIPVQAITADGSGARFDADVMVAAAGLLADAKVDVIVWNGTAGSWLGVDHDRAVCDAITSQTGLPATTSTLAILQACNDFGVTRLAIATPYTADVVERIIAEYERHGITTTAHADWGLTENYRFAARPREDVEALLLEACASGDPHAVALICTNVDGAVVSEAVEAKIGIPVIDSIAATLWWAMEVAGAPDASIQGWGAFLAQASFRHRARAVVTELRNSTGCDRTTLRVDDDRLGLHVDLCAAESCAEGVRSIQHDPTLDQRALETVRWIDETRRVLVQPAFTEHPFPPQALRDVYGVKAQVLGPVERDGAVTAWLSAHSLDERPWSPQDLAAMDTARAAVGELLEYR
ncbi:Asp/Glu racemase [Gordonia sp. zg691]|uniref:Asp/Glu racemase n=1 Tax=Gordonia jinghuaiqii TaxID=2758710 RepID=A0A7D7LSL7_9ACTN|nr:aspartate/glutamate racemase family protein [Gordonia jinghuaiqii]MBD0859671.1 Asp/Glu racemase [Gordonia jinghuaiqii]MCR5976895.1 GAF domain-containing protein [Gordonia jinghuaiqii]QMT00481.1 Asp/Glu racemase [Gordonia jinghuaiqii]